MTRFTKLAAAAAIVLGAGVATVAQADPATTTCGEFNQMDDAARLKFAHELLLWIADTANTEAAGGELIGRYASAPHNENTAESDVEMGDPTGGWTHYAMNVELEAHCHRVPDSTNIVQRLKEHT